MTRGLLKRGSERFVLQHRLRILRETHQRNSCIGMKCNTLMFNTKPFNREVPTDIYA